MPTIIWASGEDDRAKLREEGAEATSAHSRGAAWGPKGKRAAERSETKARRAVLRAALTTEAEAQAHDDVDSDQLAIALSGADGLRPSAYEPDSAATTRSIIREARKIAEELDRHRQ